MSSNYLIFEPCWSSCDEFHSYSIAASFSQNSLDNTARHCKHTQTRTCALRKRGGGGGRERKKANKSPHENNQNNKYKNKKTSPKFQLRIYIKTSWVLYQLGTTEKLSLGRDRGGLSSCYHEIPVTTLRKSGFSWVMFWEVETIMPLESLV